MTPIKQCQSEPVEDQEPMKLIKQCQSEPVEDQEPMTPMTNEPMKLVTPMNQ